MKPAWHGDALNAVTPSALMAFVERRGWWKAGTYREFSDIYEHPSLSGVIIPFIQDLRDYKLVVDRLIEDLAKALELDEHDILRALRTAERDCITVRAPFPAGAAGADGAPIEPVADLLAAARNILAAAVCADGGNDAARGFMDCVTLEHIDPAAGRVILKTAPLTRNDADQLVGEDLPSARPDDRRCTTAAAAALAALRSAADLPGDADALACAVRDGATASLCDSVAASLELFPRFEIAFDWALTLPKDDECDAISFDRGCLPAIRSAADYFRARERESSST